MQHFNNKVVWITGASSGIGEAFAYAFAREGATLVLSARREAELERVKKACGLPENKVLVLPFDVSETEAATKALALVNSTFGKVDVLINNAGLSHWSKVKDLSMDVIHTVMQVNFFGGVALTKAVLPGMLAGKEGAIVVVSSILGKIITPKQAAYSASKHALHGFYDTLRAETAAEGIRVLLVCPGFVRTNVAKNSLDRDGKPINKDNALINSGLDPAVVASKTIAALLKGQNEIIVAGTKEKFAVLLQKFAPRLFSDIAGRSKMA